MGGSLLTELESDEESFDPNIERRCCTDDERTPEERKQQEKVERKRLERQRNVLPPPPRFTGSMGQEKYTKGVANKPEAKQLPTADRYDCLITEGASLPSAKMAKAVAKPRLHPTDYLSLDAR